jgi:hypothetical protein
MRLDFYWYDEISSRAKSGLSELHSCCAEVGS